MSVTYHRFGNRQRWSLFLRYIHWRPFITTLGLYHFSQPLPEYLSQLWESGFFPSLSHISRQRSVHLPQVKIYHTCSHCYPLHLDNGSVCSVFVDFRKAFDLVDHNLLFSKLLTYNLPNFLLLWFVSGPKKTLFCVPIDGQLLRAKDDLLSEGGQSLNSIFADCFGDWFIGIYPFCGRWCCG